MLKKILFACIAMLIVIPASNAEVKSKSNTGYSIAYVNDFEGECEVRRNGTDIGEAIQDLYIPLYEGDTVSTETDSRIEVVFDDSTILKLDPNSKLNIKSLDRLGKNETIVELFKGKVIAIVKKLFEKEGFTVKTKMAMAAVKGTEFIVDTTGEDTVGVYDGAVEVSGLDMSGNVLHKIVLNRNEETVVTKGLRNPEKARRLGKNFIKRYKEISDLRGKIEYMRELRRSGKAQKFKVERRLKRIENLRTMMKSDPKRFNNLPEGQKALVNEIIKQEPYLEAQQQAIDKKQQRTSRLKQYLKKRKPGASEDTQEKATPEE